MQRKPRVYGAAKVTEAGEIQGQQRLQGTAAAGLLHATRQGVSFGSP